ncbi:MAG: amino acid ABC transporter permease [Bacillota bacterium]|nr:amino acid ABC transporter permease [Bacillota bacterium]
MPESAPFHPWAVLFTPENLRFLAWGFGVTLRIALGAMAISFAAGVVLGTARFAGDRFPESPLARGVAALATVYIEVIRNLPMLLIMLAVRFLTPIPAIWAAITGMSIFTAAIMAEIVRGGLMSVEQGQWEAAASQGLSLWQTLRWIVLPPALRRMVPALVSEFITITKDTTFAWSLGIQELLGSGVILFNRYLNAMQVFALIAVVFFTVDFLMSLAARALERRTGEGLATQ